MTTHLFNMKCVDVSWHHCLKKGLQQVNPDYLQDLDHSSQWLPGHDKIFNAFSLPINKVNYVLFGESPYPRPESANGYAFWDASVEALWSETGLSKKVNRATSLRNILKMLLVAEGLLDPHKTSQEAIAQIDKRLLVKTNQQFFNNLLRHGFLLLNATPVLTPTNKPQQDARAWQPFMQELLTCLLAYRPHTELILFGRIATRIDHLLPSVRIKKLCAEHPYNLSFVKQKKVIDFFRPFHLLLAPNQATY